MTAATPRSRTAATLDRAVFAAVVLISFVILFAPSPPSPPLFPYADKVIHAGLFAALAWSGQRAWRREPVVAGALAAYAVVSEVIQATLLAHRSGSWTDALADVSGTALGLVTARLMTRSGPAASSARGRT